MLQGRHYAHGVVLFQVACTNDTRFVLVAPNYNVFKYNRGSIVSTQLLKYKYQCFLRNNLCRLICITTDLFANNIYRLLNAVRLLI